MQDCLKCCRIVCMGGDGTVLQVFNAYYKRFAKDENIDLNDPLSQLNKRVPLPFGLICGGNITISKRCMPQPILFFWIIYLKECIKSNMNFTCQNGLGWHTKSVYEIHIIYVVFVLCWKIDFVLFTIFYFQQLCNVPLVPLPLQ